MFRIGLGQDSHKIKKTNKQTKKPLILGGILIDSTIEVDADSDGDVILHSLCNAFNTALGLGSFDIYAGSLCKKGITDSKEYLKIAFLNAKKDGYEVNNIAIAIEAGKPRLEAHKDQIIGSLAQQLDINKNRIGIAFTSGDDLTNFAKGYGIQCFSIVSLVKQ